MDLIRIGEVFRLVIYGVLLYQAYRYRDIKVAIIGVLLILGLYFISFKNPTLTVIAVNPFAALLVYTMIMEMKSHAKINQYRKTLKSLRNELGGQHG